MSETKQRIHLLDQIRGFAILCMVFFHAFYVMAELFGWQIGTLLLNFFMPAEPFFAAAFVLISGISGRLSRSNALRGAKLLWVAIALTIVTYSLELMGMRGITIWFGILHLLALSMLFYGAVKPLLDKVHPAVLISVCAILFALTYNIEHGYIGLFGFRYDLPVKLTYQPNLFAFGITTPYFSSSDYFPLLPWLFMFLIGTALGKPFSEGKLPQFFYKNFVPAFSFCGRHSLLIYLAHQPAIYGVLYLVSIVFGL